MILFHYICNAAGRDGFDNRTTTVLDWYDNSGGGNSIEERMSGLQFTYENLLRTLKNLESKQLKDMK